MKISPDKFFSNSSGFITIVEAKNHTRKTVNLERVMDLATEALFVRPKCIGITCALRTCPSEVLKRMRYRLLYQRGWRSNWRLLLVFYSLFQNCNNIDRLFIAGSGPKSQTIVSQNYISEDVKSEIGYKDFDFRGQTSIKIYWT